MGTSLGVLWELNSVRVASARVRWRGHGVRVVFGSCGLWIVWWRGCVDGCFERIRVTGELGSCCHGVWVPVVWLPGVGAAGCGLPGVSVLLVAGLWVSGLWWWFVMESLILAQDERWRRA